MSIIAGDLVVYVVAFFRRVNLFCLVDVVVPFCLIDVAEAVVVVKFDVIDRFDVYFSNGSAADSADVADIDVFDPLHQFNVAEVRFVFGLGVMQASIYIDIYIYWDDQLDVLDDFVVVVPNDFVIDLADVVFLNVVGPFRPFNVVEVLILDDLRWTQVLVHCFVYLDALVRFDVGFPNRICLLVLMLLLRILLSIFVFIAFDVAGFVGASCRFDFFFRCLLRMQISNVEDPR